MSRNKKTVIGIVAFVVMCLFLFWPANSGPQAEQTLLTYPDMWDAMNLPRLPDATITGIGGVRDPRGGVSIDLEADIPFDEVTELLEEKFAQRDYDAFLPEETEDTYFNEFNSGDTDVSVDAQPDPHDESKSKVKIVVLGNSPVNKVNTIRSSTRMD